LKEDKEVYVFDTSALLTYIEDEEGSEYVESLLIRAEKGEVIIYVAFVSLMEVFYITAKEKDESEAMDRVKLIQSLSVSIVESNESLNISAGSLKAKNRISVADAYVVAVCQEHNGILVHKDPEFEKILPKVKEFRLLYKTRSI
jgi:predicted nucleic acid-binding protein